MVMLRRQKGTDQLAMDIATLPPQQVRRGRSGLVGLGWSGKACPDQKTPLGVYNPWWGLSSSLLRNLNEDGILKGTLPNPTLVF